MTILKTKVIIPVAILIGAVATFSIYAYLEKKKKEMKPVSSVQTTSVIAALLPLSIGTEIQERDLRIIEWPADLVPPGTFTDVTKVIGRVVKMEIAENETIMEAKLAPSGSQEGFSSLIPPGMRAMTVQVTVYTGVGGFILPNANVDVMVTVSPSGDRTESSTRIILENVKVLAVDQTFKTDDSDPVKSQSVTLLVTPSQAEKLALASTEGKLLLMLRNASDQAPTATTGVQMNDLVGQRQEVAPRTIIRREVVQAPKEEPKSTTVEVIRSSKKEQVKFEEGE